MSDSTFASEAAAAIRALGEKFGTRQKRAIAAATTFAGECVEKWPAADAEARRLMAQQLDVVIANLDAAAASAIWSTIEKIGGQAMFAAIRGALGG